LLTGSSKDTQNELLTQISEKTGIDKAVMMAELEKESGMKVDQFLAQIKSLDLQELHENLAQVRREAGDSKQN